MATLLAGCLAVTVNVTFPQEKIDSAASTIEDLVRGGKPGTGEPAPPPPPATPRREGTAPARQRTVTASASVGWLGPAVAEAQVPEIKIRTPEIMAAIQSRSARYGELGGLLAKGCIGENNQGLVEPRPGTGCPPGVAALVAAENRDRTFIYQTLMQQNNMPPSELPRVQAGFARANRDKAPPGTWVQNPDGQWVRK
jgi:uncharacterized protein YdbL (DUF1318 family)